MKTNKKGMALIAALMTAFIFLALVSTLVLLSTAGSRQANYAKKVTIALHLAEAGIADAIYRLNYSPDGPFPFEGSQTPFDTQDPGPPVAGKVEWTSSIQNSGDSYTVTWNDTEPNKIVSTGTYQGIKRALSVQIRGETDSAEDRQYEKQGIPEAFNKHVVYAQTIQSTAAAPTIAGNLCGVNISLASGASGQYTVTKIPLASPPSFSASGVDSTSAPADPGWDDPGEFKDDDGKEPYNAAASYDDISLVPTLSYAATGGVETYTFNGSTIGKFLCEGVGVDTDLAVIVTGAATSMTSASFLKAKKTAPKNASITLDFSSANLDIEGIIKADTNT